MNLDLKSQIRNWSLRVDRLRLGVDEGPLEDVAATVDHAAAKHERKENPVDDQNDERELKRGVGTVILALYILVFPRFVGS